MIPTITLLADLQRVEREQGRATQLTYMRHGRYGHTTIFRRFQRWSCALAAAGLTSRPNGRPAGMPRTEAERRRDARRSTIAQARPTRRCLKCERRFSANWICPDCKRTDTWQQGA
mgnify:CR=1 FL=1